MADGGARDVPFLSYSPNRFAKRWISLSTFIISSFFSRRSESEYKLVFFTMVDPQSVHRHSFQSHPGTSCVCVRYAAFNDGPEAQAEAAPCSIGSFSTA